MPEMSAADRFARVYERMRQDGRDSIDLWLDSAENGMGGTLRLQAPCPPRKRTIPEAGFATERFDELR
jgi:hypothetical protein